MHNPLIYAFALSRAEEHLGFLRESLEQRDNIMAVRRRNATSKEKIPLHISHQRDDTNVMSANFLDFRNPSPPCNLQKSVDFVPFDCFLGNPLMQRCRRDFSMILTPTWSFTFPSIGASVISDRNILRSFSVTYASICRSVSSVSGGAYLKPM